jgi:hypothetical protein
MQSIVVLRERRNPCHELAEFSLFQPHLRACGQTPPRLLSQSNVTSNAPASSALRTNSWNMVTSTTESLSALLDVDPWLAVGVSERTCF